MIDRHARDMAADALREFMEGSISNEEYERRYPKSKDDPALGEVCPGLVLLLRSQDTQTDWQT